MRSNILIALAACTTASPVNNTTRWAIGQEVKTTSGTAKGHKAEWPAGSEVSEYLGIPFAQPPLGALRFAAPQPLKSDRTWPGDKFGPGCAQPSIGREAENTNPKMTAWLEAALGSSSQKYDEDCLTVNIWTKPQTGEKAKAVLLWIHGGAFAAGSSQASFHNGARLAEEEDVVVVSINYRLNLFGFPGAPELPDQNVGLLDQRLAIEWVRDNIAAFGGDPKRITLFGESAGAASVDFYAYQWVKDPIVAGFIAQSLYPAVLGSKNGSATGFYQISDIVGCGGKAAGENGLACMRQVPTQTLLSASVNASKGVPPLARFQPASDGKIVFKDMQQRAKAGNYIKKPMLVGSTHNEAGILSSLGNFAQNANMSMAGTMPSTMSSLPAQTEALLTTVAFTCAVADAAQARTKSGVKSWRYRYMGVWPDTALSSNSGSYHGAEVSLPFGTTGRKANAGQEVAEEAKLRKTMMHAWAEFARDPEGGLTKMGWPLYDSTKNTLIRLGYQNLAEPSFGRATEYDAGCNILTPATGALGFFRYAEQNSTKL